MTLKQTLAVLSYTAAVVFFICASFGTSLGDVPLVEAGLTAVAAGLLLAALPEPRHA